MRWWVLAVLVACSHAQSPSPVATKGPPAAAEPPATSRKVVTETSVQLLDPIKFLSGSPAIDPRSAPTLDAVAHTLTGDPSIKLVEVIAYAADAVPSLQEKVAVARAQAVVSELITRGVDKQRLRASGEAAPPKGSGMGPGPTFLILERDTASP